MNVYFCYTVYYLMTPFLSFLHENGQIHNGPTRRINYLTMLLLFNYFITVSNRIPQLGIQ